MREIFFVNQFKNASTIHPSLAESTVELSGCGDFIVKGKYTFEVGGKGKDFKQISGMDKRLLWRTISRWKLPLWLLGFMY